MDTILKTVKQHSYELDDEVLNELLFIGEHYKNAKNYIYSRYSGINSIHILKNHRKHIRDIWVKSEFANQWKLPARYWKLALDDAISNIKSQWSNIKNRIRRCAKNNENLSDEDKHYIYYILKADKLYQSILTNSEYDLPKAFKDKNLNIKYLNSLIKRLTRRYKGKVPYTKSLTFSVDTGLYRYCGENIIKIASTKSGKRLAIKLKESNSYDRTLKIKIVESKIEIHCPIKIKTHKNDYENTIGIDKGYKTLIATSSENFYGENLNIYLNVETERLNRVNKNRNRLWALYKYHLNTGNINKANNILKNNLGNIKYKQNKQKHDQTVKSYINHSINMMIESERPKEIVMENLDFVSWDNKYPKHIKQKLSRWIKGFIRQSLEFKCSLNNIEFTYVNPAYTSKVCSICGSFGKRSADVFVCKKCGKVHADINASKNILDRKDDKAKLNSDKHFVSSECIAEPIQRLFNSLAIA